MPVVNPADFPNVLLEDISCKGDFGAGTDVVWFACLVVVTSVSGRESSDAISRLETGITVWFPVSTVTVVSSTVVVSSMVVVSSIVVVSSAVVVSTGASVLLVSAGSVVIWDSLTA